jgi:hypothetical protein
LRLTVSPARLCRVVYAGFLAVRWRLKSTAFSFLNATGRPANYACLEGNANFASVSLFEETARK